MGTSAGKRPSQAGTSHSLPEPRLLPCVTIKGTANWPVSSAVLAALSCPISYKTVHTPGGWYFRIPILQDHKWRLKRDSARLPKGTEWPSLRLKLRTSSKHLPVFLDTGGRCRPQRSSARGTSRKSQLDKEARTVQRAAAWTAGPLARKEMEQDREGSESLWGSSIPQQLRELPTSLLRGRTTA